MSKNIELKRAALRITRWSRSPQDYENVKEALATMIQESVITEQDLPNVKAADVRAWLTARLGETVDLNKIE